MTTNPHAQTEAVTTTRLSLTALTSHDADDLFTITSDPRTWQHAPAGRHTDIGTTARWINRARELWKRDGLSYWMIRERTTNQPLGVGGVQRQANHDWNLYYRLGPAAWGHGYATELGRAALDAAHAHDDTVAVIAWILEGNHASRRVAERLGMINHGLHVDPSDGQSRLAYTDRPHILESPSKALEPDARESGPTV